MKVISLVNQKGGVGKTTTAVNLATAIAAIGKKVLLIDLDSQGNASTAFGIEPNDRAPSMYDVILGNSSIVEVSKKTEIKGLEICPAVIDLSAADVELSAKIGREYIIKKALDEVNEKYDFIFIDCPPSLGLLTVNALTASDSALIPLQCEFYSLEGLSYLMNTIDLVKDNLNPKIDIGGILLTMYDRRNKLTGQVEEEVRNHFVDKVFKTPIPRNVKLSEAPSHGRPGILYDHRSTGAKAYLLLAREFVKRFKS